MSFYKELLNLGEYYLAGYSLYKNKSRQVKVASALKTHLAYSEMPKHSGNAFYPNNYNLWYDDKQSAVYNYCTSLTSYYNGYNFDNIYVYLPDKYKKDYEALRKDAFKYTIGNCVNPEYAVGGNSYVHSTINYERILREGLNSYLTRIEKAPDPEFREAMETIFKGIKGFHKRCIEYLKSLPNPDQKLIKAFKQVPFEPARNFYEAMVCVNFMFYIDGNDCLGRFDQYMLPYLEGVSDEEAIFLMKNLWENVNTSDAWQVTVGGCDKEGKCGTNRCTRLVLKSTKGSRRPQVTYLMTGEEDSEIWDLIFDNWEAGTGQPALYNNRLYREGYGKHLKIKPEDLWMITFGGCTETHVFGHSCCGSTSCGLQNLLIFGRAMYDYLLSCQTYEEFYDMFMASTKRNILDAVTMCNLDQEIKAKYNPLPIRTLLIDDCIDNCKDIMAGGARYNGSSFNFSGTSNLVNSLYTIKKLGFGKKYTNEDIINACRNNFHGYEELLSDIKKLPKFGQDVEEIDEIAKDFFTQTTSLILEQKAWRGKGPYSPTFNLFITYGFLGQNVGATPDGRLARTPLGDSIGATQGDDTEGPTALINSVTQIPLKNMLTSPVFNIRISKSSLSNSKGRENVKSLVLSFFERDGMQMQATVADQKELIDALHHPEKHESLIVRIGGYAEYFNRLPNDLKIEVIKRCEHF